MPRRRLAIELFLVAAAPYLVVALFSSKAYHIDDPAYLLTARQILKSPLDFYGFRVNWGSENVMMYEANRNPPGVSYFMALGAWLFGWGERAQHLWMGLHASLLGIAMLLFARRFCARPVLATCIALSTPAAVVSSTTLMTDMPMLGYYTLALYLWTEGIDRRDRRWLCAAGICAGVAFLAKYFAITVVPLMLVFAVMKRTRAGLWMPCLAIPVAIAAGYVLWAYRLYGINPVAAAAQYATGDASRQFSYVNAGWLIGVAFTGGCLATVGMYAPYLLRTRDAVIAAGATAALYVLIAWNDGYFLYVAAANNADRLRLAAHYALFAALGAFVLGVGARAAVRDRSPESVLLVLWMFGTFVFATFLNWSITARTILPMAVPAAVLVVRALPAADANPRNAVLRAWAPVGAGFVLSLFVAHGDYKTANLAREAAERVIERDGGRPVRLWYMGHWGFAYYMEEAGGRFLWEGTRDQLRAGDRVAMFRWLSLIPLSFEPGSVDSDPEAGFSTRNRAFVSTHHPVTRSGFYSNVFGPLPFTFGPPPDVIVDVVQINPS